MKNNNKKNHEARRMRFAAEYIVDLNATAAAGRAGYRGSAATLAAIGSRLLSSAKVAAEVQRLMGERRDRTRITADDVLLELSRIATVDLSKAFDERGALLPIHEIPEAVRRAIASVEVVEESYPSALDDSVITTCKVKKVKFVDKLGSLHLLGKHLALWVERVEHTGAGGRPLAKAGLSVDQVRDLVASLRKGKT